MRNSIVVVLVSSLGLFACGGSSQKGAAAPEADPWADYKGTYATAAAPRAKEDKPQPAKAAKTEAAASETAKTEDAPAPVASKKASRGTIRGESISSIQVDALTDATKGASKSAKVVSSDVVVGEKYELMQVQLKGWSVQIVRPATKPDPNGPPVGAPKARELSKTESSWYDEDADVLVVVNAGKKASAQKVLGNLLKR